jgi:hypothetical protein
MGRDIGRDISIMTPVYNEKDNLPINIPLPLTPLIYLDYHPNNNCL